MWCFSTLKYVVLQFHVSFCCSDNVLRWERAVQDDEDELETAKQSEQKQMADIERDMRRLDVLKSERLAKKSEVDSMDDLIGKVCNWLFAACCVLKTAVSHVLGPMKEQYLNHIIPPCNSINVNATAWAVRLTPVTAEGFILSKASPCGICGGEIGISIGFSPSTHCYSTKASYSFIYSSISNAI